MASTLLIPSGGYATRLYPLSKNKPKILIEINGVPLFHKYYLMAESMGMDNIIVVVNEEHYKILTEFINDVYSNSSVDIIIVVDAVLEGPLCLCEGMIGTCREDVYIVLSDTLYDDDLPVMDGSYIIYREVDPPLGRWCLVETDKDGRVLSFWDKPEEECPTNKALIGVYKVKKTPFKEAYESIMESGEKVRGQYQISQALDMYNKHEDLLAVSDKGLWHDTGTLGNLRETSFNMYISRGFNNIQMDEDGSLKKVSTDIQTLRDEYIWYEHVESTSPVKMIPHIYGYEEDSDNAFINMECIMMNDLGTVLNFSHAMPVFFSQVMDALFSKLDKLYRGVYPFDSKDNESMLIGKMSERLSKTPYDIPGKYLDRYMNDLYRIAGRGGKFRLIHGDLCISNILFDPQRMIIRFIDPRGSYGEGLFGDVIYDLAKLLHSFDAKYETVLHQLYNFNEDIEFLMGDNKLKCFDTAIQKIVDYASDYDISEKDLYLVEAGLYFSMLPLHSEKRQKVFFKSACNIIERIYGG